MNPHSEIHAQLIALLPRLLRFARTLTSSAVTAEDLVQAVCVRVIANAETWSPGTRFDAWIFRILRNQWIDWGRKMRAEGPLAPIDDEDVLPAEDGEVSAISKIMLAQVQRGIEALPPEQREVLLLVCHEEMSYREVAELLDVPVGTVMSRLSRARKRLLEFTEAA